MAIIQDVIVNTRQAVANIKKFNDRLRETVRGAGKAGGALDRFKSTALGAFAAIVAYRIGAKLVAEFSEAVRAGIEFSKTLAEIETLMPEAARNTGRLRDNLLELSNAYGQDATTQARGFYDVVSAGVQGFENQLDVLNTTNKVAIGGITDTATATNVLVGTMNAFAANGETASSVADILFTTVRQGITTIPQLASVMGQVNATAANTGVELKEVGAAMATLTANGVPTAQAATGIKAAIAAFSKPTKEASMLIKKLGIDFSVSAIQQKGFRNVLTQVREATGGNTEALIKLFPNQRAQLAVLPLLGKSWEKFDKQLDTFNNTAGAADQAFERVTKTASFQADRVTTSFKNVFVAITSIIDEPLAHWLEGVSSWFQRTSLIVKIVVRLTQLFVQGLILLEQAWVGVLIVIQSIITALAQVGRLFGSTGKAIADATSDQLGKFTKRANDLYKMQGRVAKGFSDFLSGKNLKANKPAQDAKALQGALKGVNDELDRAAKKSGKAVDPLAKKLEETLKLARKRAKSQKEIDDKARAEEDARVEQQKEAAGEVNGLIREAFGEYKAFQIADAIVSTYTAANKALAAFPPPFSYAAAAAAIAAGLVNVQKIRQAGNESSFQQGGIVPGNQFEGDRVVARVNSGELILNRAQQQNLFNAIDSGNLGGGGGNITVNVTSLTGDIPQRSLDRMIDQIRERVVTGNKRFV